MLRRVLFCLLFLLLPLSPAFAAERSITASGTSGRRAALVIGNGDYRFAGTLANPVNDARLIAQALREVGFELHGGQAQTNLSRDQMLATIEAFGDGIRPSDVALFYYSGHGLQVKGENYLVPVDANIKGEAEVSYKAVEAGRLLAKLEIARNSVNIVVLDACRNNPFARSFRSASAGLAAVNAPAGTIVAFSTGPGQVAEDGSGGNSTYSRELSRYMREPGLKVEDVFKRVRSSVNSTTGGGQLPWENTSLTGDFLFVPGKGQAANAEAEQRLREAEEKASAAERRAREAEEKAAAFERHNAENPLQQVAMAPKPKEKSAVGQAEATTGMEFVAVTGGCYQMGDTFGDGYGGEKPVHEVCVNDFAIGKTEVTQGQWKKVMGNNPSNFSNCGDDCPVEMVSWTDVQEFIRKLNQQSGRKFRLPTEAEWEYAARSGGKREKYAGSDNIDTVAWYGGNSGRRTHLVGQKPSNGLGLYDMSGNVWEWCSDWYDSSYYGSSPRQDPQGLSEGSFRVGRGGGWGNVTGYVRVSNRNYFDPGGRFNFLGFRLALPAR